MDFAWDETMSVGVRVFDAQHKYLVAQIRQLSHALREGSGEKVIENILSHLAAYTSFHFKTEESYMLNSKYPEHLQHQEEHNKFKYDLAVLIQRHQDGDRVVNTDTYNFLRDWILYHIKDKEGGHDSRLGKYLIDNGHVKLTTHPKAEEVIPPHLAEDALDPESLDQTPDDTEDKDTEDESERGKEE
ncbi:bacteriohemerythrin [bacterium]|nr:bacteriohemerythrin [bacterium]